MYSDVGIRLIYTLCYVREQEIGHKSTSLMLHNWSKLIMRQLVAKVRFAGNEYSLNGSQIICFVILRNKTTATPNSASAIVNLVGNGRQLGAMEWKRVMFCSRRCSGADYLKELKKFHKCNKLSDVRERTEGKWGQDTPHWRWRVRFFDWLRMVLWWNQRSPTVQRQYGVPRTLVFLYYSTYVTRTQTLAGSNCSGDWHKTRTGCQTFLKYLLKKVTNLSNAL